jgi:hypothetical protein
MLDVCGNQRQCNISDGSGAKVLLEKFKYNMGIKK